MDSQFHTVRGYQLLRQNKRQLTSAMEDYLEMIYRSSETEGFMRINRLADMLNVRASSATKMVQKLGSLGLIQYERYGIVVLTEAGKEIGRYLLNRHRIIEEFLHTIGIRDNLLTETELIEHNISPQTLEKIVILNDYFAEHPEVTRGLKQFSEARPR